MVSELSEEIVNRNNDLSEENVRLQKLVTKLQEENYRLSNKVSYLVENFCFFMSTLIYPNSFV